MMCHDGLAPLFHPIGECFSVARSSYTIVIVEVTGISNSFDAKLRVSPFMLKSVGFKTQAVTLIAGQHFFHD